MVLECTEVQLSQVQMEGFRRIQDSLEHLGARDFLQHTECMGLQGLDRHMGKQVSDSAEEIYAKGVKGTGTAAECACINLICACFSEHEGEELINDKQNKYLNFIIWSMRFQRSKAGKVASSMLNLCMYEKRRH